MQPLFDVIFDKGEGTCFSADPKGVRVYKVEDVFKTDCFFSINPIDLVNDRRPTEEWHRADVPRRADHNVTCFRNILVEMDKMPLDQQRQYISEIGMPFTSAVFSGSKSIHFIISLEVPLTDRTEYDLLVKRVYRVVGNENVDRTCKNPSRFSRVPGHVRTDTGKVQEQLELRGRVPNSVLEEWLTANGAPYKTYDPPPPRLQRPPKDYSSLTPGIRNFLAFGAGKGLWNPTLFKAACEFARGGWTVEEAIEEMTKITGHLDALDMKTIHSAYRNEQSKEKENETSTKAP